MSPDILKRWIEAGKILAESPDEEVLCPTCQEQKLNVTDIKN